MAKNKKIIEVRLKVPSEHLGKPQHCYDCVSSKPCLQSALRFLSVRLSLSLLPLVSVGPLGLSQPLLSLINRHVGGDGEPPEEQRASRPESSIKKRKKKGNDGVRGYPSLHLRPAASAPLTRLETHTRRNQPPSAAVVIRAAWRWMCRDVLIGSLHQPSSRPGFAR